MKMITNANQLTIIKPVSPPKISKTLDVQANDATYFTKQAIPTSIPLINIKNNYEPLIHIKHTYITLINIINNDKPLIHIKNPSITLINIKNNYEPLIHTKHTSTTLIALITMISH